MSDFVDADACKRAAALMGEERFAVLALCHEGQPRCFQMAVALGVDGRQVYMAASQDSSKYLMLAASPQACLFFSSARNQGADPHEALTLEVHGAIETVSDTHALQARQLLCARHPSLEGFFVAPATKILALRIVRLVFTERFQRVSVLDLGG